MLTFFIADLSGSGAETFTVRVMARPNPALPM
jgi:hypothetical protein